MLLLDNWARLVWWSKLDFRNKVRRKIITKNVTIYKTLHLHFAGYCKVMNKIGLRQPRPQTRNGNGNGSTNSPESQSLSTIHQASAAAKPTRGSQPRRTFLRKQQEEHTLGLILIGMSTLFIFCQSFKIIPDLYELIVCNQVGSLGHNCAITKVPAINVITRMSHLLVCFNSSANFLIYYLNGEKFRRAWVETYGNRCCCCACKTTDRSSGGLVMQSIRTEHPVVSNIAPTVAKSGRTGTNGMTFFDILVVELNCSGQQSMGLQIILSID